jgi:hypothetical protein
MEVKILQTAEFLKTNESFGKKQISKYRGVPIFKLFAVKDGVRYECKCDNNFTDYREVLLMKDI